MRLVLVIALAAVALAVPAQARAAGPVDYLLRAQNADGGWGVAPGSPSTHLTTGWAALGLAAAGRNPAEVRRAGRSPLDFLRRDARSIRDTGELERTILVLRAAGGNPRRFGGRDLVAALLRKRRADGSISGYVSYTSFGILALRAAGLPRGGRPIAAAVAWLRLQQNDDGGFNVHRRGGQSGIDDTGYALQALAAGGAPRSSAARRAVRFLTRQAGPGGGFPLTPGGPANAQSTAYAMLGLAAAGRAPAASTLAYLRGLRRADGSIRYSRTSSQTPVWVTAQALMALRRAALPLAPVRRRVAAAGQEPDGGFAETAAAPREEDREPETPAPRDGEGTEPSPDGTSETPEPTAGATAQAEPTEPAGDQPAPAATPAGGDDSGVPGEVAAAVAALLVAAVVGGVLGARGSGRG